MEIRDRVLVVEDDKRIGNFFRTVLEANHYDVIMAQTGAEAYSMVTSQCPDVVLLDLGLPDMDGMRILKSIREWSAMPVIVVSARTHERDKVEALDLGADDYITKPFGTSELLFVYLGIQVALVISGGGVYSLDALASAKRAKSQRTRNSSRRIEDSTKK